MIQRILTETAIRAFHDYLVLEEKSAATVEKYIRDARAFCAFLGAELVTKEQMMAYKKDLMNKGKNYNLGSFSKIEDAVAARKKAEERIYGEFLEWYYSAYPNQKPKKS